MWNKFFVFLISFIAVVSYAISINQESLACIAGCTTIGVLLLFMLKRDKNNKYMLKIYMLCSILMIILSCIAYDIIHFSESIFEESVVKENLAIYFLGLIIKVLLGYFIIRQAEGYCELAFMLMTVLMSTMCYQGFQVEYLVLNAIIFFLVTISEGRKKGTYDLRDKIVLVSIFLCLCVYNWGFLILGIVFALNEMYSDKVYSKNILNLRYILYIGILAYLLFIKNGYTPKGLWSQLWQSYEGVNSFYAMYTLFVFAFGILNWKREIKLREREIGSVTLIIGILFFVFHMDQFWNGLLITSGILGGIYVGIPTIKLEKREWAGYLMISYGISLMGIYMLDLVTRKII